jgi:hypothetical protein
MRTKKGSFRFLMVVLILALTAFPSGSASANHSWGTYHWARTSNPFTLTVIDSMTSDWDDNLNVAINDWDQSSVMNLVKEAGDSSANTRKRCRPVAGKVRSCNAAYGNNGWLGLAQIWISGGHISQGTAKMNDSYMYVGSSYTETNRQHVICQEIGHDWGLGHQDESGADLNTCMDYSNNLDNPHPNAHDYAQLETIYNSHLDSSTTIAAMPPGFANADIHAQENWGEKVSDNGKTAIFVRDFGDDNLIFTFVFWAE